MTIDLNTKIASLIKEDKRALEAIVSISPKFEKLRNPLMRKIIGGRTSIAMAAKIGGCNSEEFFSKLQPLGFEINRKVPEAPIELSNNPVPDFLKNAKPGQITVLDVRPLIDKGNDPLNGILKQIKTLPDTGILKIVNSFEPRPLVKLLEKQGFEFYVEHVSHDLVNSYFTRRSARVAEEISRPANSADWKRVLEMYRDNIEEIDVRELEMPLPMHAILDALSKLPANKALFVHHKRIPVFLLPELAEMKFSYRVNEKENGQVDLLIYKD